jgi:hypothetical protein
MKALLRGLLWTPANVRERDHDGLHCVRQEFELLRPSDQAALLPEGGLRRPWLQFDCSWGPYPRQQQGRPSVGRLPDEGGYDVALDAHGRAHLGVA